MFFPFDSTIILLLPALAMAFWAQAKVKSTFKKYSKVHSASGLTGENVARKILDQKGLYDVKIEPIRGSLTDHYDPSTRTVRLSEPIYNETSVAALGIAAHETGHAIQHSEDYSFLRYRHALLKPANLGSMMAFPMFLIGMFVSYGPLMTLGIILFTAALAFQVVTLPVEFDASRRALVNLRNTGLMADSEVYQARSMLTAAAWTYVAAATMALSNLIRLLILRDSFD